ncbi:cell division protein ZipA [Hahella sp. CR1]|uniref:cell division protein ZipA n=1 Tax=Hahella sp. CR1 TaxID=2992807 RepID=UPI0024430DE5|nr:cell division protein ZipA [Hahella sp. CR1]MDG9667641.1 cell division protein ZipA [Hahella sp. CR1]
MDISLREWLIMIGLLIILGVVIDGFRRVRRARKDSLEISQGMGGNFENTPIDDDFNPELPGSGFRVIKDGKPAAEQNYTRPIKEVKYKPTFKPSEKLKERERRQDEEPYDQDMAEPPILEVDEGLEESMSNQGYGRREPEFVEEDEIEERLPEEQESFSPYQRFEQVRDEQYEEEYVEEDAEADDDGPYRDSPYKEFLKRDNFRVQGYQGGYDSLHEHEPEPEVEFEQEEPQDEVEKEEDLHAEPIDRPVAHEESQHEPMLAFKDKFLKKISAIQQQTGLHAGTPRSDEAPKSREEKGGRAGSPGKSSKTLQEILVINVLSKDEEGFEGVALRNLVEACGMQMGDMAIFHRYEHDFDEGPVQFSMANAMEPGVFGKDMASQRFPGVCFFVRLPGPDNSMRAFDYMVETAQCLVRNLGGELKDENRSVMTAQTIEHCRQRVREFERRMLSSRV